MADKWIQLMSEDGTDNLFPTSKMDLLWTNSSPTSSFSAQTISLDLSGYGTLVVSYLVLESATTYIEFVLTLKNVNLEQFSGSNQAMRFRTVSWNDSGITFSDCNSRTTGNGTGSTLNTTLIPYRIYGIK